MLARRYKSYAWAFLEGGVGGCDRPLTLNPTSRTRAAAAGRPTLIASLPHRRFEGTAASGGGERASGRAAGGAPCTRAPTAASNPRVSAEGRPSGSLPSRLGE